MGLPKCVTGRPMWRRTEPNEGPHLDPPDLTRWHTLCPHVSVSSHTHTYQHRHHTKKISSCLYPHPLAYTHSRESLAVTSHSSLSLSRPLSFLVLSLPCPHRPLYPCLSRIRNTHTYLSRPRQMHQLHIHTCYITYPIDLKSPLFTFILHTTFLLNKVWPKIILEFLHIYNITKLYGGVRMLICIALCPQWYLFRTVNLYIFILYTKLVIIKRNEEHLSLHRIPPLYAPFTYAHKTISRSSKSKPPENSRMFHLSLAIYAMTIIVFEAKARYVHWTSESTHYGHHLCLVVII